LGAWSQFWITIAPQVSPLVHGLPSLHDRLNRVGPVEQTPFAGLHVPELRHTLVGQTTGFDPAQAPALQVSVCVQALASLQVAPFAITVADVGAIAEEQAPMIARTL
jgi:hypothetical protein